MMRKLIRRSRHVDPEELDRQTSKVNARLERETDRMNTIASYLEKRKNQNGFGADFEYTLRPRRAS